MRAVLVLGFLMGLRHALEADHLAAVAALATRSRGWRATALQGAAWGVGHATTLVLVGGACLVFGAAIPESWARTLELVVGVVLAGLGLDILRRLRRERVHVHVHQHDEGLVHLHAHRHEVGGAGAVKAAEAAPHRAAGHEHPHGFPKRALLVGLLHGLAGSAALLFLAVQSVGSTSLALLYIGLYALGSVLGMAALSAVIALPLGASLARYQVAVEAVVGLTTLAVAARLIYVVATAA